MSDLLLKQELTSGETRTWKLKPGQKTYSLGSSRHADLISLSDQSEGIEAVFDFKNGTWHFINMSEHLEDDAHVRDLPIEGELTLDFKNFKLHLTPTKKEKDLIERILSHSLPHEERRHAKPYQLFVLRFGNQIREVKLLKSKKKYRHIEPILSEEWSKHPYDSQEVWQRTVYLNDNDELLQFQQSDLIDSEMKTPLVAVGISALVIVLLFLFAPRNVRQSQELPPPSRVAQRVIVKVDKPPAKPKPASQVTSGSPARGRSAVEALSIGRVSQLIGKVSSREAKSKVILLGSGAKAGSQETGRALAAIGKLNRAGSDWGTQPQGDAIQVSTGGKGGGKNTSGLGRLSAGSTGSANVGLIEDETEVDGGLDKEVIAQYIRTQLGQILYCYERQLSANPNLYGKVAVKFTIGPSGSVETSGVSDTTLKSIPVESCVLSKIALWKFPAPKNGTRVVVTYPFLFKSTN